MLYLWLGSILFWMPNFSNKQHVLPNRILNDLKPPPTQRRRKIFTISNVMKWKYCFIRLFIYTQKVHAPVKIILFAVLFFHHRICVILNVTSKENCEFFMHLLVHHHVCKELHILNNSVMACNFIQYLLKIEQQTRCIGLDFANEILILFVHDVNEVK